jgi:hypothetical protein
MQIVDHEAVKLSSKNATTFHERVAMYFANQTNSEGYDSESCYSELTDEQDADLLEDQFRYLQPQFMVANLFDIKKLNPVLLTTYLKD